MPSSKFRAWLKPRRLAEDKFRELVQQNTDGRDLGIFGDPGVNVLQLNLALDQQHSMKTARTYIFIFVPIPPGWLSHEPMIPGLRAGSNGTSPPVAEAS